MTGSSVITEAASQGMMSLCGNEDAVLYRKLVAAPKEQQQDRHSVGTAAAGTARAAFRPAGSAPLRRIKPSSLVGCAASTQCIGAPCQRLLGQHGCCKEPSQPDCLCQHDSCAKVQSILTTCRLTWIPITP